MQAVIILLGTSADSASNFWQEAFRAQHEALTVWTPQRPKNESVERVEISWPDCLSDPVFHFRLQVLSQCLSLGTC